MEEASVKVAVRIRPLSTREQLENNSECITYIDTPETPNVETILLENRVYSFDYCFRPKSAQSEVYDKAVKPMISSLLEGYNATILAYGQTGSGKTFTMGTALNSSLNEDYEQEGIVSRFILEIISVLENKREILLEKSKEFKYELFVSFLELYNEELIDLLSSAPSGTSSTVQIREDGSGGIYWAGVTEQPVSSSDEMFECLRKGTLRRTTASTDMNQTSSRSHAIFSVILKQVTNATGESSETSEAPSNLFSKFHFVDLAGSERIKKTKAVGDRMKEGISINSGLLAMGKVIHALNEYSSSGNKHIPYRDSKLTRLLQDSLGGNSKTLMIACVSPAECNFGETMNTLNYASRARNIKNKVQVNQDYKQMEVHQLRAEIARLKMDLLQARKSGFGSTTNLAGSVLMEAELMQLRNENSELKLKLEMAETVRDSLLLNSDGELDDAESHPLVLKYRGEINDLKDKLNEFQNIGHSSFNPTSAAISANVDIIEKAKVEIKKDLEYIEKIGGNANISGDDLDISTEIDDEKTAESTELLLISKLNHDIVVKEELVNRLEKTQSEYKIMKDNYEQKLLLLQDNLKEVEREKETILKTNVNKTNQQQKDLVSHSEQKIQKLLQEIQAVKKRFSEQQKEQNEKRLKNELLLNQMKQNIQELKDERLRLIKRIRDKDAILRKEVDEKQRQAEIMKRKEKQFNEKYKRLEQQAQKNSLMLKRRTEETLQAKNKLRNVMSMLRTNKKTSVLTSGISGGINKKEPFPIGSPPKTPTKKLKNLIKRGLFSQERNKSRPKSGFSSSNSSLNSSNADNRIGVVVSFKKNILSNLIETIVKNRQSDDIVEGLTKKKRELELELSQLNKEREQMLQQVNEAQFEEFDDSLNELENRIYILEAEINYYQARINSAHVEAAQGNSAHSPSSNSENDAIIPHEDVLANCVEMVNSLDVDESHKLLEMFLDDMINLKLDQKQNSSELEKVKRELTDTLKTLQLTNNFGVGSVLNDIENVLNNENFQVLSDTSGEEKENAHDKRPSNSGNIFERLHREQTIASQAKIHPSQHLPHHELPPLMPDSTSSTLNRSEKGVSSNHSSTTISSPQTGTLNIPLPFVAETSRDQLISEKDMERLNKLKISIQKANASRSTSISEVNDKAQPNK